MKTFKMGSLQSDKFRELVTTDTAKQHGRRRAGQDIELHHHNDVAVYQVVSGQAELNDADGPVAVLGPNEEFDSVEVQPWELHGWKILVDGTNIDHVTTTERVGAVLAFA